jgi:mRNA-degrading endonuclease RelE of RelBE toxin-antitoxin system
LTGPGRSYLSRRVDADGFVTEGLPTDPHHLGSEFSAPYEGRRAAHLGTYRVGYRIDEPTRTVYALSIRLRGDVYEVR